MISEQTEVALFYFVSGHGMYTKRVEQSRPLDSWRYFISINTMMHSLSKEFKDH